MQPNPDETQATLGGAKSEALKQRIAEREAASAKDTPVIAATKTLRELLPDLMAESLPEGDVLPHFIRIVSEVVAKQEAESTPHLIAKGMSDWIAAHPDEQRALERLVKESYRRRLERRVAAVSTPQTDREVDLAVEAVSKALLAEHVPERWVRERMKEKRRDWSADVRENEKNWELLERSLPEKDVLYLRESIQGDEETFRSRTAELTKVADRLSDRVRHAIGVVAMHAEKQRLYETVAALARLVEPTRTASERDDTGEATPLKTEKTAEIQAIIAALPGMSERNRAHRQFLERLTFLGVQPSQDDWEQFLRSYDAAMRVVG